MGRLSLVPRAPILEDLVLSEFEAEPPAGLPPRQRHGVPSPLPPAEPEGQFRHTSMGFSHQHPGKHGVALKAGSFDAMSCSTPNFMNGSQGFSETASMVSTSTSPSRRRPGTGRFHAEELACFKKLPLPSPLYERKQDAFLQTAGELRRACSDGRLQTVGKSEPPYAITREGLSLPDLRQPESAQLREQPERTQFLPDEGKTTKVLDQIFPRGHGPAIAAIGPDRQDESPQKGLGRKKMPVIGFGTGTLPSSSSTAPAATATAAATAGVAADHTTGAPIKKTGAQIRLLHFRQKILEKFSTMKSAFDVFAAEGGGENKELTRKEFSRFLNKHFGGLSKDDHERVFDFLDADKNGSVSLAEFLTAIEAAAPVTSMEDLRRKWIALGFASMRQVFIAMDRGQDNFSKRISLQEFGVVLSRVGVHEVEEHQSIFVSVSDPNNPTCTTSISELASAMAAVSPSLLLEDIRDRLIKKYGTVEKAYDDIDKNANGSVNGKEFMHYAIHAWKITPYEAQKAFRLIDIDKSRWIGKTEFCSALKLSEPSLALEDIRRKVRQRFRSIREAIDNDGANMTGLMNDDFPQADKPPSVSFHASVGVYTDNSSPKGRGFYGARESGIGLGGPCGRETPDDVFKAFKRVGHTESDLKLRTPHEWQHMLGEVQMSDADSKTLFELVDINRDGKLCPLEFVRGIRLFAPSCIFEDLRLKCLRQHNRVADAFTSISRERREAVLDAAALREILEELNLATGIKVEAVVDLVEAHRDGGVTVSELTAALQCASPGVQVRLSPDQRDARARQQVRWQMAPFHKTTTELRAHIREKAPTEQDERRSATASLGTANVVAESVDSSAKQPGQEPESTSPDLHSKQGGHDKPRTEKRRDSVPHPPMKQSYVKVSRLLKSMSPEESGHILEDLHGYYSAAGNTVANDNELLLEKEVSRFKFSRQFDEHKAVLSRPLL